MIVGKKVFLCGKNIFQNINGRIYFWILFVILTCLLAGNSNLYPLTHQEISYHGCLSGITLALFHLLFIDKFLFRIENKMEKLKALNVLDFWDR